MSAEFEVAKSITEVYDTAFKQGAKMYVPDMERALHLIRQGRINATEEMKQFVEAEAVLLDAIRRAKGLPF